MIIHLSIAEFSASVALAQNPSLTHVPFVIAQGSRNRAIVLSPSPAAHAAGISVGMRLVHAQLILPSLQIIEPDYRALTKAQASILDVVAHYTPTLAPIKNGSFFLDMSGTTRLFGPAVDSASRLRSEIHRTLGFDGSVAVASNALVANVATRTIAPAGLACISPGQESDFLHSQKVTLLPGVGPKIAALLHATNIYHIGELAALEESQVRAFLGTKGLELHRRAQGISSLPLTHSPKEGITKRVRFEEPLLEYSSIKTALRAASEDGGFELRTNAQSARRITLTITYSDGKEATRSTTLSEAVAFDWQIIASAEALLSNLLARRLHLLGFSLHLSQLQPFYPTGDLFDVEDQTKQRTLQASVDAVRRRYGIDALSLRGSYGK